MLPGARVNMDNYIFLPRPFFPIPILRSPCAVDPSENRATRYYTRRSTLGWLRKRGLWHAGESVTVLWQWSADRGGSIRVVRWWHNWYHSGGVFFWGNPTAPLRAHNYACPVPCGYAFSIVVGSFFSFPERGAETERYRSKSAALDDQIAPFYLFPSFITRDCHLWHSTKRLTKRTNRKI